MDPVQETSQFLLRYLDISRPLLLGLSGGADSLCLLYCLLECQKTQPFIFHIAHIDHGWRAESKEEASELKNLATALNIPFHCKRLNPAELQGNLENRCRQERQAFFKEICLKYDCQGVVLGHHRDDQAETVLKRLLEGSSFIHFSSLKPVVTVNELLIFRPFLDLPKSEIRRWLAAHHLIPFEDKTNEDPSFLRARMRKEILPWLNETFGKKVDNSLVLIAEESQELKAYLDARIEPLWMKIERGPLGLLIDLTDSGLPLVELKHFIRELAKKEQFFISREELKWVAEALQKGLANRHIKNKMQVMWVDRGFLFIITKEYLPCLEKVPLKRGVLNREWRIEISLVQKEAFKDAASWREGWSGKYCVYVPAAENYLIGPIETDASYYSKHSLYKFWNQHKIPAFLRHQLPVIWKDDSVYGEFLTGHTPFSSSHYMKVELIRN